MSWLCKMNKNFEKFHIWQNIKFLARYLKSMQYLKKICRIWKFQEKKLVVLMFHLFINLYYLTPFNSCFQFFRFFEVHTVHNITEVDGINTTTVAYAPTELRLNSLYINLYVTWMYLVFMYIIPFSTLAIFNMLTWLEMRRALARRAQLSG